MIIKSTGINFTWGKYTYIPNRYVVELVHTVIQILPIALHFYIVKMPELVSKLVWNTSRQRKAKWRSQVRKATSLYCKQDENHSHRAILAFTSYLIEYLKNWKSVRITHAGSWMVCKQYIVLNHVLSEKTASFPQPFPTRFPAAFPTRFPAAFPTEFPAAFPTDDLHILKISRSISHKKCISEANC